MVAALATKDRLTRRTAETGTTDANPFLPYEPAMFVANASPTHVCLLNKFNVVDDHLLIVTREFEDQQSPLTEADFAALWTCMTEYDALGFYNAGAAAGASQPHKHLQMVPLPLASSGPTVPIDPLIDRAVIKGRIGHLDGFPFRHALARHEPQAFETSSDAASALLGCYQQMMEAVGLGDGLRSADSRTAAYNLLVTRRWMLLVPRSREHFEGISLNALAFAGALLVRDSEQLQLLKRCGPMTALRYVAQNASS
jgi:ATP adenylyltransferase